MFWMYNGSATKAFVFCETKSNATHLVDPMYLYQTITKKGVSSTTLAVFMGIFIAVVVGIILLIVWLVARAHHKNVINHLKQFRPAERSLDDIQI